MSKTSCQNDIEIVTNKLDFFQKFLEKKQKSIFEKLWSKWVPNHTFPDIVWIGTYQQKSLKYNNRCLQESTRARALVRDTSGQSP